MIGGSVTKPNWDFRKFLKQINCFPTSKVNSIDSEENFCFGGQPRRIPEQKNIMQHKN